MATNNFIVDPSTTSVQNTKQQIIAWLKNKEDYERWKDFYESSSGNVLIDIMASILTVLSYHVIVGRREAYLKYAQNYSSCTAIAENLGYNVFRGRNAIVKVTLTSTTTKIVSRFDSIGTVLDKDLIALEDTIINADTPTDVNCVVGLILEEEITAPSDLLAVFRFTNPNVSDDARLYVNETEAIYSEQMLDLSDGKFVLLSNGFGSVDALSLNTSFPMYNTGDKIRISYIELNDTNFVVGDIELDVDTLNNAEITSPFIAKESKESIVIKAPLYHETQYTIRGREDFRKVILQQNAEMIDARCHDLSPAIVEVTYLRQDKQIYLPSEKEIIKAQLNDERLRPNGIPESVVVHPLKSNLGLDIVCILKSITAESIEDMVDAILDPYTNLLGTSIDTDDIEQEIENNDYIKVARASLKAPLWTADTLYSSKDFVSIASDLTKILEFERFYSLSGATEPVWPTVVGETVIDQDIVWECVEDDRGNLETWQASNEYYSGMIVKPTDINNTKRYVLRDYVFYFGVTEPAWPTTDGEIVVAGNLVLTCRTLQGAPPVFAPSESRTISEVVVPTAANGKMYQVIGYLGQSGTVLGAVGDIDDEILDGKIVWKVRDAENTLVSLKWNEFFDINRTITVQLK